MTVTSLFLCSKLPYYFSSVLKGSSQTYMHGFLDLFFNFVISLHICINRSMCYCLKTCTNDKYRKLTFSPFYLFSTKIFSMTHFGIRRKITKKKIFWQQRPRLIKIKNKNISEEHCGRKTTYVYTDLVKNIQMINQPYVS